MEELEEAGHGGLPLVSWVEVELDPSVTRNVRKHALGGALAHSYGTTSAKVLTHSSRGGAGCT